MSKYEPIKFDVTDWPHQRAFLASKSPYRALYGGVDNGKTFALCLAVLIQSLTYPKGSGALCRATYPELRDTTRKVFFELLGCNEETIRDHPYVTKWAKDENLLRFINGSEVRFRHLGDERAISALLSNQYDCVGIDQAEEVSESAFTTLSHRIGRVDSEIPQWIALVGNPAGHDYIWERFKRDEDEYGYSKNGLYHLIEAETLDNPIVGEGYVERLRETLTKREFQRFVLGSWDTYYGRVYEDFTEATHVIDGIPIPDSWKIGLGMDFGWSNPTAAVWLAVDNHGIFHQYQEYGDREKTPEHHSKMLRAYGIESEGYQLPIFGDPAMKSSNQDDGENLMDLYAEQGIVIMKGNNKHVLVGISLISQLLKVDPNRVNPYTGKLGCPRLLIHRCCTETRREYGLYRWKHLKPGEETEKPEPDTVVKVNDHYMDATRYNLMSHMRHHKPKIKKIMPFDLVDYIEAFETKNRKRTQNADWRMR